METHSSLWTHSCRNQLQGTIRKHSKKSDCVGLSPLGKTTVTVWYDSETWQISGKKKSSSFKTSKTNVNLKIKVGKLLKAFRGSSLRKSLGNMLQKFCNQVNIKADKFYIEKSNGKQALRGLPQPLGGTWSPQWWGLCGVCSQLPSALPAAQSAGCSPESALQHTRAQIHTEMPPQAALAKAAPATECKPFFHQSHIVTSWGRKVKLVRHSNLTTTLTHRAVRWAVVFSPKSRYITNAIPVIKPISSQTLHHSYSHLHKCRRTQ